MCIFTVLLVNKYLSSSELELILTNVKHNNNYYYTIKTSFIHIYDSSNKLYGACEPTYVYTLAQNAKTKQWPSLYVASIDTLITSGKY